MLQSKGDVGKLWSAEKQAALQSIAAIKDEALTFLAAEREQILRMSHNEALAELIRIHRLDSRIQTIKAVADNDIFDLGP